jgi:hypothetical protein
LQRRSPPRIRSFTDWSRSEFSWKSPAMHAIGDSGTSRTFDCSTTDDTIAVDPRGWRMGVVRAHQA